MTLLYLDESGCLNFNFSKEGASSFFSISVIILNQQRPIVSLVKKVFRSLPKAEKRRNDGTLHAHYEKSITIKRLLLGLQKKDIKISSICLDKHKVLLTGKPHELYTSMVVTLINRLHADGIISTGEDIKLVASRVNTSKHLNNEFLESVISHIQGIDFDAEVIKPSDDKCLQAVDFVSWALWQKYENGDEIYSDIIADKIVKEYIMYE